MANKARSAVASQISSLNSTLRLQSVALRAQPPPDLFCPVASTPTPPKDFHVRIHPCEAPPLPILILRSLPSSTLTSIFSINTRATFSHSHTPARRAHTWPWDKTTINPSLRVPLTL